MSKFSGQFDFYDKIQMIGEYEILNNYIIYKGNDLLSLRTLKDCIPYYPYIISMSYCNDNGNNIIKLSSKSSIEIEEEKYGHMKVHDLYRQFLKDELNNYKEDNINEVYLKLNDIKKEIKNVLSLIVKETSEYFVCEFNFNHKLSNIINIKNMDIILSKDLIDNIKNIFSNNEVKIDKNKVYIYK